MANCCCCACAWKTCFIAKRICSTAGCLTIGWRFTLTMPAISSPPSDVEGDAANPDTTLFYVMDDRIRMRERVIRLGKNGAHGELPRSKVRHIVSNIRVERDGDLFMARSSFAVSQQTDVTTRRILGHHRHE